MGRGYRAESGYGVTHPWGTPRCVVRSPVAVVGILLQTNESHPDQIQPRNLP